MNPSAYVSVPLVLPEHITTAVTHNSRFHSDDLFAAAALRLLRPEMKFIRTRDEAVHAAAEFIFDIGGFYVPEKFQFDHHQIGRAGKRANGIDYAAFGLIWKHFGVQIAGDEKVAAIVDQVLVSAVDAMDNGINLMEPLRDDVSPYLAFRAFMSANPTWREDVSLTDEYFYKALEFAVYILQREIINAQDAVTGYAFVEKAYEVAEDKRMIMLDGSYPFKEVLLKKEEPLYVVRPTPQSTDWKVEAIPKGRWTFENRKPFPEAWAGLKDADLAAVTGVPDAKFCHTARFLAVAKSREGAIALARLALDA